MGDTNIKPVREYSQMTEEENREIITTLGNNISDTLRGEIKVGVETTLLLETRGLVGEKTPENIRDSVRQVILCDGNGMPIKRICFKYRRDNCTLKPDPKTFRFENL